MSEDYHISFASLYESKYYKDFARRSLKELLGQHGLRVPNPWILCGKPHLSLREAAGDVAIS
jgi:hypothetical protein